MKIRAYAVAVAIVFSAGLFTASHFCKTAEVKRDLKEARAELSKEAERSRKLNERIEVVENERENAQKRLKSADLDRYSLDATIRGLHEDIDRRERELAAARRSEGEHRERADSMQSDMLKWCTGEIAEIAEYADRMKAKGLTCERLWR